MNIQKCRMNNFVFEIRDGKPFLNGMMITGDRVTIKVFPWVMGMLLMSSFIAGGWVGFTLIPLL